MASPRYLVAARKYRPQVFGELVSQEHVTETLGNALRMDRLAHAYLFSGPRGVGKTTAARILAKAINCTTPEAERAGGVEPCRTCESCRAFEEGRSLNIIELDAASNNKAEDMRDLRDTVRVPPQGSRKKVYIVDEVHMLSTAAFNVLLKTLEEPPPYVMFIFATTEPHKVLPTILSRCQRFDFRRIPVEETVHHLRSICETEGIEADEASLLLIARKGDGALRDALSAFDQAVSLCGTDLRYAELARALGVVDTDLYFEVTGYVRDRSTAGMLTFVERLVRAGYDIQEFLGGMTEHLRNLLAARALGQTNLIEAPQPTKERYAEEARVFSEADLLRLLTIADEALSTLRESTQPRLKLELALLKMASLTRAADLRQMLAQLSRLERLAEGGKLADLPALPTPGGAFQSEAPRAAPPSPPPAPTATAEPEQSYAPTPARADTAPAGPAPEPTPATAAPSEAKPTPAPATDTMHGVPPPAETPAPSDEAPDDDTTPPAPPSPPTPPQPKAPAPSAAPPADTAPSLSGSLFGPPALSRTTPRRDSGEPTAFSGDGADTPAPTPASSAADTLVERWPQFVRAVKAARVHVGVQVAEAQPLGIEGETLSVAVPDELHRRLLHNQHDFLLEHIATLGSGFAEGPGAVSAFRFVVQAGPGQGSEAADAPSDPSDVLQALREKMPAVDLLVTKFGGEIAFG